MYMNYNRLRIYLIGKHLLLLAHTIYISCPVFGGITGYSLFLCLTTANVKDVLATMYGVMFKNVRMHLE